MRFKVKVITPTGVEKTESNNAPDEGKLRDRELSDRAGGRSVRPSGADPRS